MLRTPGWPVVLALVNPLACNLILGSVSPLAATIAANVGRAALMIWAGRLVGRRLGGGALAGAVAGVTIMVVDHVLLKGGTFLFLHLRGDVPPGGASYLMAFAGVMVSFVMFSPVAALFGFIGWRSGRRRPEPAGG